MTTATKNRRKKVDLSEPGISQAFADRCRKMAGIPQDVIDAYFKHVAENPDDEDFGTAIRGATSTRRSAQPNRVSSMALASRSETDSVGWTSTTAVIAPPKNLRPT